MPAPRIERDHRALQARVPTTQTRQARTTGAEPTGYDPATSRVTGGRAAHCATAPQHSVRCEWRGERMTTSPGSRVSCEIATHPPATARVAAYCDTHKPSVVKELGPEMRIAPPASAQVGRLTRPGRDARGAYTIGLGPSMSLCALHSVFVIRASRPRFEVAIDRSPYRLANRGRACACTSIDVGGCNSDSPASLMPLALVARAPIATGHTPARRARSGISPTTAPAVRHVRASRNTEEAVMKRSISSRSICASMIRP
jgi:hypothetical protein